MTAIWINGEMTTPDEARISAFDAGIQHGVGLFETLLAREDRVIHLLQHLDRLAPAAPPHRPGDAKLPLPSSDWSRRPQKLLPWQERQETPENYEDAS